MDKVFEVVSCVLSATELTENCFAEIKGGILQDAEGKPEGVQKLIGIAMNTADRLRDKANKKPCQNNKSSVQG